MRREMSRLDSTRQNWDRQMNSVEQVRSNERWEKGRDKKQLKCEWNGRFDNGQNTVARNNNMQNQQRALKSLGISDFKE
jgi:hypothetical protein